MCAEILEFADEWLAVPVRNVTLTGQNENVFSQRQLLVGRQHEFLHKCTRVVLNLPTDFSRINKKAVL